jgi:perosamine synthetase
MTKNDLPYIYGGKKTIINKLPYRKLYWENELKSVTKVFKKAWSRKTDFGFQGEFEKIYTKNFVKLQGRGYADAVNSGSSGLWVAINSLKYKNKHKIAAVSPVTNPGGIMPLLLKGFKIIVIDSSVNSYNICPKKFDELSTKHPISLLVVNHSGGMPCEIEKLTKICKKKNISLIEDCSQAHGAIFNKKKVGNFGDISVFSTMYRKNVGTGGCGGIVFTKNKKLFNEIRSHADRGKPFEISNYDPKDVKKFKYPALNLNLDELSCSIGISTLSRLDNLIKKRLKVATTLKKNFLKKSSIFRILNFNEIKEKPSIYFLPIYLDLKKFKIKKEEFVKSILGEGVDLNPDYQEIVCTWPWIKKYLYKDYTSTNAIRYRNNSFNLFLNERYDKSNIDQIFQALLKVENYFINEKNIK